MPLKSSDGTPVEIYSPAARAFHWWTVAFVMIQIPLGIYMVYRGTTMNMWDDLTSALYSSHKLIGMTILLLVLARLAYRLSHGAPADEPTLAPWQKRVSHVTHWGLYALLIGVPIGGWLGVSLYGSTGIFNLFNLPSLAGKDPAAAEWIFALHAIGGFAIVGLVALHVGAAVGLHHMTRKDNVLRRMLPRKRDLD